MDIEYYYEIGFISGMSINKNPGLMRTDVVGLETVLQNYFVSLWLPNMLLLS